MTMVPSGQISLGGNVVRGGNNESVNVQLGFSPTATISMNDVAVRGLAVVPTPGSTISMTDFYGKPVAGPSINLFINANSTTTFNVHTAAVAAYGSEPPANSVINVTVAALVAQGSLPPVTPSYTDNPALRSGTGWNTGITINLIGAASSAIVGYGGNNGFTDPAGYGRGASGQVSGGGKYGGNGQNGGDAFWVESANVTVNVSGFLGIIAGGGGGGGGGNGPNGGNGAGGGGTGAGYAAGGSAGFGTAQVGFLAGKYGNAAGTWGFGSFGNGGAGGSQGTGSSATSPGSPSSGGGGPGGTPGVAGTNGVSGVTATQAGQGGGGGGLGAAGGFGGDLFFSIGGPSGGSAGAKWRRVGGVGTVTGSPGTAYGPIKNT